MSHDEYWKKVMNRAEKSLCRLFEGNRTRVRDIVGDKEPRVHSRGNRKTGDGEATRHIRGLLRVSPPSGLDLGQVPML